MRLFYDIETNRVGDFRTLSGIHAVHCICAKDIDTDEEYAFFDVFTDGVGGRIACDGTMGDGIRFLEQADLRSAHNGLNFDEPVLKQMFDYVPTGQFWDTELCSRVIWPDLKERDWLRIQRGSKFPKKFAGSYALEAFGHRLGVHKGSLGDTNAEETWERLTPEMLQYCAQDVAVGVELFKLIEERA